MATETSGGGDGGRAPGPSVRSLVHLVPEALNNDPVEVAVALREQYGPVVRIPPVYPGLEEPAYLVTDPADVQSVLQTHPRKFAPLDTPGSSAFGEVVRDSVVSLTEDSDEGSWLARIRKLSPEFSEEAVAERVPALARETQTTLAALDATGTTGARRQSAVPDDSPAAGFDRDPAVVPADDDGAVRALPAMRRLSLRLLGVSVFGGDVRLHEERAIRALATLRDEFRRRHVDLATGAVTKHLPERVELPGFLARRLDREVGFDLPGGGDDRARAAIEELEAVARAIVERRERTPRVYDDALSTWMTRPDPVTGETLSGETVRSEVVGLLLAGFATLSAAMTWALYLTATRPWVQDRIHEEARETPLFASLYAARNRPDGGETTLEDLPYTHRVWRETLRLYPALPVFGRTTREEVTVGEYELEAGAPVLVSPYVTHRDPDAWDRPAEFDPSRFTPERRADRPEFAYYPFSGGPHACLGRAVATTEAVTALASIFSTHRVELVDPDPDDAGGSGDDPVGVDSAINLQPDRAIAVRFVRR